MPNAVVAIDQSSWNDDATTNSFWGAMTNVNYDMVWTTGVGDKQRVLRERHDQLDLQCQDGDLRLPAQAHRADFLVDTSAGASSAGDSWSTAGLTNLNARIADGVIAANITGTPPNGLQTNITGLASASAIPVLSVAKSGFAVPDRPSWFPDPASSPRSDGLNQSIVPSAPNNICCQLNGSCTETEPTATPLLFMSHRSCNIGYFNPATKAVQANSQCCEL